MKINFSDVQRNVSEIANRQVYTTDVLYELMAAYGRAAASITKLRSGNLNLATDKTTTVLQRGVVYFKVVTNADSLPAEVEKLEQDPLTQRYNPRFLIATDLKTFAAKDTKKGNTLEIAWENIDRNVDFFYGWTGDEVTDEKTEAAADRRAADKMKELYQELEKVNADKFKSKSSDFRHHLNVFFTRLLFCFFAEDTRVFSKEDTYIFTGAIKDYTQIDGSDLDEFLSTLFACLDEEDKSGYTSPFSKFPYVNGKIFDKKYGIEIPKFNAQARKLILDCGALSWAEINPDIFGSMFQSIVDEEHRSTHGMHYTSVPNIMKTIEPLFLDELRDEFDKHYDNPKQLQKLHERISKIKVFDPACGSGNFLIIAYKELRKLEHAIIERLFDDDHKRSVLAGRLKSKVELDNFYGIEIDDFACEVAVLSLYLAKHQMNIEFEKQFGLEIKLIPLKDKANIRHGNAARIDWQDVCPNVPKKQNLITEEQIQLIVTEEINEQLLLVEEWDEIYLIGNPPYQGARKQTPEQKEDFAHYFKTEEYSGNLDYIALWFIKGARYISGTKAELAFVSTNSVCQGEHVSLMFPKIYHEGVEIGFAYTSFKWTNSAAANAGVTVIIINFRPINTTQKKIYTEGHQVRVDNINAYLTDSDVDFVTKNSRPISNIPDIAFGSMPNDGGHLILSKAEMEELIKLHPDASKYIKFFIGAEEYINGIPRYCLWIEDKDYQEAMENNLLSERINKVKKQRTKSKRKATNKLAKFPYKFGEIRYKATPSIIIPEVSSQRREYIPIGYIGSDVVVSNKAFAIYDAELSVFSILNSKIHMVWVASVSGRLKNDFSYSSTIVYNNFPIRELTKNERAVLEKSASRILFARENHTEKTLAEMYDPDKMPGDLQEAHHQNDILVDKLYRQKPYANDEERLADLFKLYEEMIAKEKKSI